MTRVSAIGTVWLLGTVLVAACGDRTGLGVEGTRSASATDAGPASCAAKPVPVKHEVPNLYFVLDHSGSMKQMNKWPNVRAAVADLMTTLGPNANFGASLFPNPVDRTMCGAGVQIMPLTPGDTTGNAAATLLSATQADPSGGTPTAATFLELTPLLGGLGGATFAVLATDGGPNCNAALSCSADQCTANIDMVVPQCTPGGMDCCDPTSGIADGTDCLDAANAATAVAQLAAAGVPTFVMGIPGSAPYDPLLNQLAQAGHTARPSAPYYYSVDTADTKALSVALNQIAARIISSCTLVLGRKPLDPNQVNVLLDNATVPRDTPDGWTLSGAILTLLGTTCQSVLDGQGKGLVVTEGCPTVTN